MTEPQSRGSYLDVRRVSKRYGNVEAVRGVTLGIRHGEFFSLLGPSGCGKTTTLRMIAGFVTPSSGEIYVQGRLLNAVPAYKRNMSMVFQNYALFPHLSVFANIAFGLRMRGLPRTQIKQRVHEVVEMVRLTGLTNTYPRQLSGGQQQRVALARALVLNPVVLLLDEPLSNLDAKLRQEMRIEIRGMVKRLGMTAVYVTHDQEEALAMSDRIAIMRDGIVEQVGSPTEIYDRPETLFVASFIGSANIYQGHVKFHESELTVIETDDGVLLRANTVGLPPLQRVAVVVRPEKILLVSEALGAANKFRAKVRSRVFVGETTHYVMEMDNGLLVRAHRQNRVGESFPEDAFVDVGWGAGDMRLIPLDHGAGVNKVDSAPSASAVPVEDLPKEDLVRSATREAPND